MELYNWEEEKMQAGIFCLRLIYFSAYISRYIAVKSIRSQLSVTWLSCE